MLRPGICEVGGTIKMAPTKAECDDIVTWIVKGDAMLEAGPELDAKVAEACGVAGAIVDRGSFDGQCFIPASDECVVQSSGCREWSPSTDLNAAFEAAEMVSLFSDDKPSRSLGTDVNNNGDMVWLIYPWDSMPDFNMWGGEPTPALAICAAILELKK